MTKLLVAMPLFVVACSGPAGPAGPDGPQGPAGSPAATVNSGEVSTPTGKITESLFCNGGLSGTTGLNFNYDAKQMDNGNVFVSASVYDLSSQSSTATIYTPTQNGYLTASVNVTLDEAPPANSGYFSLSVDRKTLVTSIVYHDSDVGIRAWTMPATSCVHNVY